ncbi:HAD-IA family hydrolase [Nocardia nova]|uniref:HAD family hydrolase n=1 Tax=Nocardia nova TaxID=37330 RepID=UPI001C44BD3D|nr:HAD-IA family hydrolase [Nocardia nova]MBV7702843.1 HAD-IA family hydrolase [Nocardia nova]
MNRVADLVASRRALLLDFDGPICAVFSDLTNREAARRLAHQLDSPVPTAIAETVDPFDVLQFAATLGTPTADKIERAFRRIEVEAVATSRPTPDSETVIRHASKQRRAVAIVSNNSADAIAAYLAHHELSNDVSSIFARTSADVSKLKPNPYLLNQALSTLDLSTHEAVFVGDSVTDIEAARAAHVAPIAFANRAEKIDRFAPYAPDAVITSMAELAEALQSQP